VLCQSGLPVDRWPKARWQGENSWECNRASPRPRASCEKYVSAAGQILRQVEISAVSRPARSAYGV
jgi:hypothetical protein